ncbi:hypothetical protein UFOVP329_58 [uncultured Caudovirales phage]|uniref:Uncharacterized protein n=1 Tax=uncultured Caudovirales phage TaxID=2100421 RepID=A0A6J5LZM2_9CAUD|nr:hypothetical protein UFOVP329_58 [uncultured Caudovirales phage]
MANNYKYVLGVDHSIKSVGMALVRIDCDSYVKTTKVLWADQSVEHSAWSKINLPDRIAVSCNRAISILRQNGSPAHIDVIAYEGFARGFMNRREEAGIGLACAMLGIKAWWSSRASGMSRAFDAANKVAITPRQHKVFCCPKWPGLSKANWLASPAHRGIKYKSSMPDKVSVQRALARDYGHTYSGNINALGEHAVDAIAIALTCANRVHADEIARSK